MHGIQVEVLLLLLLYLWLAGAKRCARVVQNNGAMKSISTFELLGCGPSPPSIAGSIVIVNNPGLSDLVGFDILEQIQGSVRIEGNSNLDRFLAFPALATVGGHFVIDVS